LNYEENAAVDITPSIKLMKANQKSAFLIKGRPNLLFLTNKLLKFDRTDSSPERVKMSVNHVLKIRAYDVYYTKA